MTSGRRPTVCVIGAGVIGLSSACRVQDELPDVDVTVISDEFSPNTTGDGAAGFWRPYYVEGTPDKLIWYVGQNGTGIIRTCVGLLLAYLVCGIACYWLHERSDQYYGIAITIGWAGGRVGRA